MIDDYSLRFASLKPSTGISLNMYTTSYLPCILSAYVYQPHDARRSTVIPLDVTDESCGTLFRS